ncbi:MAG TPA: CDGSH iron-sulfur domain-containing protein [Anaerolineales bacterium]|nr:CDGSH iron-sulfur domain-containing protein [Anaerolineales bacterium]
MMENIEIKALKNGPYLIAHGAIFTDAAGNVKSLDGKSVALCRCGQSANKPFCDGTHKKINFEAEEATLSLPVLLSTP